METWRCSQTTQSSLSAAPGGCGGVIDAVLCGQVMQEETNNYKEKL